jgi:hypothetical protein
MEKVRENARPAAAMSGNLVISMTSCAATERDVLGAASLLGDRRRLGGGQFDRAFSAGSRLTQREAVAVVWDQRRTGTLTS